MPFNIGDDVQLRGDVPSSLYGAEGCLGERNLKGYIQAVGSVGNPNLPEGIVMVNYERPGSEEFNPGKMNSIYVARHLKISGTADEEADLNAEDPSSSNNNGNPRGGRRRQRKTRKTSKKSLHSRRRLPRR